MPWDKLEGLGSCEVAWSISSIKNDVFSSTAPSAAQRSLCFYEEWQGRDGRCNDRWMHEVWVLGNEQHQYSSYLAVRIRAPCRLVGSNPLCFSRLAEPVIGDLFGDNLSEAISMTTLPDPEVNLPIKVAKFVIKVAWLQFYFLIDRLPKMFRSVPYKNFQFSVLRTTRLLTSNLQSRRRFIASTFDENCALMWELYIYTFCSFIQESWQLLLNSTTRHIHDPLLKNYAHEAEMRSIVSNY